MTRTAPALDDTSDLDCIAHPCLAKAVSVLRNDKNETILINHLLGPYGKDYCEPGKNPK